MAFAGRDVAEARWFGYPTFWVNRLDPPVEELAVAPGRAGHAVGGLELTLWCDLRIAAPHGVFDVFCRRCGAPLLDLCV